LIKVETIYRFLIKENISVLSIRSVLFLEETGEPGENHRPVASH
jgi:hypothetical protein